MNNEKWSIDSNNKSQKLKTAKRIRLILSSFLALAGVGLILSQAIPLSLSYLRGVVLNKSENIVSPVPIEYRRTINGDLAYYDPGTSYFENLLIELGTVSNPGRVYDPNTKEYKETIIDGDYNSPMNLTIPSLEISSVNINPNVESYDEDIYNAVLKNGLAHFKGTPIPGDGGNSFIYGHSAVQSFFSGNSNNPEIIFTKLENISIGDEVIVEKEGKELVYVVRGKKIVKPDDFSILSQEVNNEQITLMTCHPAGLPTNRLIVTATLK